MHTQITDLTYNPLYNPVVQSLCIFLFQPNYLISFWI